MIGIKEYRKFYNYDVYEDGRVFSHFRNRFLKGEITKFGYLQYALCIDGEMKKYKAHQLVARLFLDKPSNYKELIINHKDGNKLNNHYSNLEYCTYNYNNYHARINELNNVSYSNSKRWDDEDFRRRVSANISKGQLKSGCNKGEKNGRYRYEISSIDGIKFTRTTLAEYLKKSQSYTDALIRRAANGERINLLIQNKIYIRDVKGKVNRLSKAADNEKDVA